MEHACSHPTSDKLIAAPPIHVVDFLAELVSRTKAAAPRRTQVTKRLLVLLAVGDFFAIGLGLLGGFALRFVIQVPWVTPMSGITLRNYASYMIVGMLSFLAVL